MGICALMYIVVGFSAVAGFDLKLGTRYVGHNRRKALACATLPTPLVPHMSELPKQDTFFPGFSKEAWNKALELFGSREVQQEHGRRLDALNEKIDALKERIDERIDGLSNKFDRLTTWLTIWNLLLIVIVSFMLGNLAPFRLARAA